MKKSIAIYVFIAALVSIIQVLGNLCSDRFHLCGERFCCCNGYEAVCINQNLTYIPKLPKGLSSLKFIGNNIQNLSTETFGNISVSSLEFLGLYSDGIINIRNDTFKKFSKLQKLSLQNNEKLNWSLMEQALYSIPDSLNCIYLDNTGLINLTDNMFVALKDKSVKFLTLRNNSIFVFNEQTFKPISSLKSLDFTRNKINQISLTSNGTRLGLRSVKSLSLAYNDFSIRPPSFCDAILKRSLYPSLETLDLTGNLIMILDRKAWFCLSRLKKLILRENAIKEISNDSFLDLKSLETLHVSHNLKAIQTIAERAFHNPGLKELNFENNNIDFQPDSKVPYDSLFTFCPNLTKLLIGHNYFRSIYNTKLITMLSPLTKLTELHIDSARLYEMPVGLFIKFHNLTKLYMGNNKLQAINPNAFIDVSKLTVLHLEANKIKVINDSFPIALRHSLRELNLAGNPFSCSFCTPNNNTWFRNWIESSKHVIKFIHWPSFYKCASPPSEHETLFTSHRPKYEDCVSKDPMIVAYATICSFLVVLTLLGVVGYRSRWYIRYWTIKWQRRCGCSKKIDPERQRLLGNDNADAAFYDAFILYHEDDRAFVRGEILPFMETQHKYKLFIWDRDFTAGDQTVGIVVDNIYKSNHVLTVVSKSFLKDQWCDFQLAVCLDRQIELKKTFLTLLTLDNVDRKLLSKFWCILLTKTVTAEWCDRKNDIRRKLFESQILSNIPCMEHNHTEITQTVSVNENAND